MRQTEALVQKHAAHPVPRKVVNRAHITATCSHTIDIICEFLDKQIVLYNTLCTEIQRKKQNE